MGRVNTEQTEGVRRRRTRAEVEKLVAEYEGSGLGRQEFCDKQGLSLTTLNRYRKRQQLRSETATAGRLIPVEISPSKHAETSQRGGELLVWLSSGRKIEVRGGFDPKVLQELVRVLEQA